MPYFETSSEWLGQSSLLLKARPTTTRITSKYSVLAPKASKVSKSQAKLSTEPIATIAAFTLKTYDPASGVCLKYQTNKAAEVGRLVGGLGKLARQMAALPEVAEVDRSVPIKQDSRSNTPVPEAAGATKAAAPDAKLPQAGGAGKKKKKGKK